MLEASACHVLIALISDLHSNLEALEAALADIDALGVETIVCLGDVVGYGASPRQVIQKVQERCLISLQGNHDAALLDPQDRMGFNERAMRAVEWTHETLDPSDRQNWALWDWLGGLKPNAVLAMPGGEEIQLVHASPREPLTEYLMPTLGASAERVLANFAAASHRLCFYGHTHHPGWFAEGMPFERAVGHDAEVRLEAGRRYLINVGSIGQPRDSDPRLSYALFDGETLRYRRVDYDFESAAKRILSVGLPESLAARLLVGR